MRRKIQEISKCINDRVLIRGYSLQRKESIMLTEKAEVFGMAKGYLYPKHPTGVTTVASQIYFLSLKHKSITTSF